MADIEITQPSEWGYSMKRKDSNLKELIGHCNTKYLESVRIKRLALKIPVIGRFHSKQICVCFHIASVLKLMKKVLLLFAQVYMLLFSC